MRHSSFKVAAASLSCAFWLLAQLATPAFADERDQAKRLHDRIAGVPPSPTDLTTMTNLIANGDLQGAAEIALNNPSFYNVTLKNFVTPWTNREQSVFAPLNDYTATVIGMVRDNVPFNTVLSEDILYIVDAPGLPAPSATSNAHYEQAEAQGVDLSTALRPTTQSSVYGLPPAATAGVITTRAAAEAFFIDGTNRAMFRFTLMNHLCRDLEQVADTSRPPDRIRQDVARSPGGDSRIFLNNCVGCHSGMDPMTQAFAYYDFHDTERRIVYTEGVVNPKYFLNENNFKPGYITPDDRWDNYWRKGPNARLGWDPALPGSGKGAKSLGMELANSDAFADCQVRKVFRAVCFREPTRSELDPIKANFRSGYSLRQVFADAATTPACLGN